MIVLFAWGGKTTQEVREFDKYTGICTVNIVEVNPTIDELRKIYQKDDIKEPNYIGKDEDGTESLRIELFIKPSEEFAAFDFKRGISYYIKKKNEYNKNGDKVRVINKYGQNKWITVDSFKAGIAPDNQFAMPYRAALVGEIALIDAMRKYLCIANPAIWNNDTRTFTLKDVNALAECEGGFSIEDYQQMFAGNFTKIKSIFGKFKTNKIKYLFGVKTKDGKEYQTVAERFPIAYNAKNMVRVFKDINNYKEVSDTFREIDFGKEPYNFTIYAPTATDFSKPATTEERVIKDPFAKAREAQAQAQPQVQQAAQDVDPVDDLPF